MLLQKGSLENVTGVQPKLKFKVHPTFPLPPSHPPLSHHWLLRLVDLTKKCSEMYSIRIRIWNKQKVKHHCFQHCSARLHLKVRINIQKVTTKLHHLIMPSIFIKEQKILQQPVDFLYLKIAGQKLFNFLR
jgi:hypothetical protein